MVLPGGMAVVWVLGVISRICSLSPGVSWGGAPLTHASCHSAATTSILRAGVAPVADPGFDLRGVVDFIVFWPYFY